jgi:DNA-directed RNA polymerase specialized sigma24 family protein
MSGRAIAKHRDRSTTTLRNVLAEVVDPEDAVALRQRVELLAEALADLDPLHREVVLLRDIQELSARSGRADSVSRSTHSRAVSIVRG